MKKRFEKVFATIFCLTSVKPERRMTVRLLRVGLVLSLMLCVFSLAPDVAQCEDPRIGSVAFTPSSPQAGDSVLVEVCAPDGQPYDNREEGQIWINGVAGSRQYIRWDRPGIKLVFVLASSDDGPTERVRKEIVVQPSESNGPYLTVKRRLQAPTSLEFTIVSPNNLKRTEPLAIGNLAGEVTANVSPPLRELELLTPSVENSGRTMSVAGSRQLLPETEWDFGILKRTEPLAIGNLAGEVTANVSPPLRELELLTPSVENSGRTMSVAGSRQLLPEYEWDFGDGVKQKTRVARVVHDFGPKLHRGRQWSVFNVTVRKHQDADDPIELHCTVSVLNDYELNKRRGVIQPRVQQSSPNAHFVEDKGFVVSFTVKNIEQSDLKLTSRRVELFFHDQSQPSQLLPPEPVQMLIKSESTASFMAVVPKDKVPIKAVGFAIHFAGKLLPRVKAITRSEDISLSAVRVLPKVETRETISRPTNTPPPVRVSTYPVRVSTYYDIPSRWMDILPRLKKDKAELLTNLVKNKQVSSDKVIYRDELKALIQKAEVSQAQPSGSQVWRQKVLLDDLKAFVQATPDELRDPIQKPEISQARPSVPLASKQRVFLSDTKALLQETLGQRVMSGHLDPTAAKEGEECDPTNLPPYYPTDLACQATNELDWKMMPGRFMNAKKGDIVLSSSTGLIGGLLRQLDPPQYYSHAGIMTRNHDEITHSTVSEDRIEGYPVGSIYGQPAPSQGFQPDVLKYAWPGIITQEVKHAVEGESFIDTDCYSPEDSECEASHKISGFNPDDCLVYGRAEVIPPLVIKPPPMVETPGIRAQLYQAGDVAITEAGRGHYRFFAFTDPSVVLDSYAPSSAGWASGTYGTICSSFVWNCLRQIGAKLEGAIEPMDEADGAELGPDSEDGLYLYQAYERLDAGEWLFGRMRMKVQESLEEKINSDFLEFWAEVGSDIADDVANQFLNTFATDWSDLDAADSDDWRNTTDACTVSPDNILFWDSPETGGLYGHSERLIYREERYEPITIHRWCKVHGTGSLSGRVWYNGQPIDGARVELYDLNFAVTANGGLFHFADVPEGNYLANTYIVYNQLYLSAKPPVTVMRDKDTYIDIELEPPSDLYRAVKLHASTLLIDDEYMAAANPISYESGDAVLRIGPYDTHDEVLLIDDVCDGDVRARLYVEADLVVEDRSVTISFTLKIYETADTEDGIDSEMTKTFKVAAGGTGVWHGMKLFNDDKDSVKLRYLEVFNDIQNN